jgi:Zn-dependent protease with chaperone function
MDGLAEPHPRSPRPNPFAFASDTTFRFVLLICAVAAMAIVTWSTVWVSTHFVQVKTNIDRCESVVQRPPATDALGAYQRVREIRQAMRECVRLALFRPAALAGLAGMVGVLAVAALLYWCMPAWRIRRHRLKPLEVDAIPGLGLELRELQHKADVHERVRFLVDPLSPVVGAVAFGRVGRRYIALYRGLLNRFTSDSDKDREEFRAVVRHELAHLRNRDLDKTYLTVAVWWAFVLAGLIPFLFDQLMWLLYLDISNGLIRSVWRVAMITLLVILIRNAVLRSRELYADMRVTTLDGDNGVLRRVLGERADRGVEPGRAWRVPFRKHPPYWLRCTTLDNPTVLLQFGFWEALATGVVAALAVNAVQFELGLLVSTSMDGEPASAWWSGALFAPLTAGIVGLGLWRATFASSLTGKEEPVRYHRIGIGLGLGLALGDLLDLGATMRAGRVDLVGQPVPIATVLIGAAIVVVGSWLLVRWVAMAASAWMGAVTAHRSPRVLTSAAVTVVALVLAGGLPLLLVLQGWSRATNVQDALGVVPLVLSLVMGPTFTKPAAAVASLGFLTLLWVYPLVGAMRSDHHHSPARWTTLDGVPPTRSIAGRSVNLSAAARTGLVAGGILIVLLVSDRLLMHMLVPQIQRQTQTWQGNFYFRMLMLAIGMQALAAVWAALRVPVLRVPHGLLAAFITGIVAVLGVLSSLVLDVCRIDSLMVISQDCSLSGAGGLEAIVGMFGIVLRVGGIVALAAVLLTVTIIGAQQEIRRRLQRTRQIPTLSSVATRTAESEEF